MSTKSNQKDLATKCTAIVKRQMDNSLVWQCPFGFCATTHNGERALELHLKRDHAAVDIVSLSNVWDLPAFLTLLKGLQICHDPASATPDQRSMLLCPVCRSIGVTGSEVTMSQHLNGRPQCGEWNRMSIPALDSVLLPRDETGSDDDDDEDEAAATSSTQKKNTQQGEEDEDSDWDSDSDFEMEIEARCLYCDTVSSSVLTHMKEAHGCDLPQLLASYKQELKKPVVAADGETKKDDQREGEVAHVVQANVDSSKVEHFNIRFVNFVRKTLSESRCPSLCGMQEEDSSKLLAHIEKEKHFGPASVASFPEGFHDSEELLVPFLPKDGLIQIVLMMRGGVSGGADDDDEDEVDYPMIASMAELASKKPE